MDKLKLIRLAIEETSNQLTGKLGVGFEDLKTNQSYCLNGQDSFPIASLYKIFVLAELFRKVNNGDISLEIRKELEEKFKSAGSGITSNMRSGTLLTIYDYALLMMIISDNTSADFLYNYVGKENVKENVLKKLNLNDTKADFTCNELFLNYCNATPNQSRKEKNHAYFSGDYRNSKWFTCTTEKNNSSTPNDVGKMLHVIYSGEWCNNDISTQMLEIMKLCQTNSRIPRYLPKETPIAHKTGSFDRVSNDAGIIYTQSGNYILSLFYNGNVANESEYYITNENGIYGDEALAKLSRKIYDIYTQK